MVEYNMLIDLMTDDVDDDNNVRKTQYHFL